MRGKLPIVLSAIAVVVAVLGASSPAIAHGVKHALFAHNADKVDGRHANQLVRATTVQNATTINDFGPTAFEPLLSRTVKAPTKGILLVWGTVAAVRDVSDPDIAVLNARVRVGADATTTQTAYLEFEGVEESSLAISGAIPVEKGDHEVILEGYESEAGLVFVTNRSITTLFVPFGNMGQVGVLGLAQAPGVADDADANE